MMKKSKRRRPKIGDIIEIPVASGFAYAQYTHHHAKYGELLALLPGVFPSRPVNVVELTRQQELYYFFLPLRACLRRDQIALIGKEPIPASRHSFPVMRAHGIVSAETKTVEWFLWNGEQYERIEKPDQEFFNLSVVGVWGFELLVLRINEGWNPDDYLRQYRDDVLT